MSMDISVLFDCYEINYFVMKETRELELLWEGSRKGLGRVRMGIRPPLGSCGE